MAPIIMDRKKCKKCFRGKLETRAKRALIVKVTLFWLPVKRYRCDNCHKKTYILGSSLMPVKRPVLQIL
jgi:hypothetical protein